MTLYVPVYKMNSLNVVNRNDKDDDEEVSDDSCDGIFNTRRRITQKRVDRFESPTCQKNSKPEETFTRPLSPNRHMSTSLLW